MKFSKKGESEAWLDGAIGPVLKRFTHERLEKDDLQSLEIFFRAYLLYDHILINPHNMVAARPDTGLSDIEVLCDQYGLILNRAETSTDRLPPSLISHIDKLVDSMAVSQDTLLAPYEDLMREDLTSPVPTTLTLLLDNVIDAMQEITGEPYGNSFKAQREGLRKGSESLSPEQIYNAFDLGKDMAKKSFSNIYRSYYLIPAIAISYGIPFYTNKAGNKYLKSVLKNLHFEQRPTDKLLSHFDKDWKDSIMNLISHSCFVPPFVGIVFSEASNRNDIPTVLKQIKKDWQKARQELHENIQAASYATTLAEQVKLNRELENAFDNICKSAFPKAVRPVRKFFRWTHLFAFGNYGAGTAMMDDDLPNVAVALVDFAGEVRDSIKKMKGITQQLRRILTEKELADFGLH